jgi:hypothetical protein
VISEQFLVGGLAIGLAVIALASAIGPWSWPYRSRSMKAVCERHGKGVARLIWLLIAVITGASGVSILSEVRPGYAAPILREELRQ